MDSEFWHQRWREGRIGFHQAQATPLLVAHWPTLELPRDSRVFVPRAGKSLDMPWLAAQGHRVLGVELSPLAVARFFEERGLVPRVHDSHLGRHHVAGAIELICGDVFDLDAQVLADCAAVYDRAALIALPPELRRRAAATPILTSEQIGTRRFAVLAEVAGRSCVREPGADPSIEIAREELKLKAAALDADADTSTLCRASGLDVMHSCTNSIECRGDAIRWVS